MKCDAIGFGKFFCFFLFAVLFLIVVSGALNEGLGLLSHAPTTDSKFGVVEEVHGVGRISRERVGVIVDKETGVEYIVYYNLNDNITAITPRLTRDGKPYIQNTQE